MKIEDTPPELTPKKFIGVDIVPAKNCRKYWSTYIMFSKYSHLFLYDPAWQTEDPKIVRYQYISEVSATVRNVINTRKD
jgi:hypothetical protein